MLEGLSTGETGLAEGVECLLNVTGRHFKVSVQSVQGEVVRVSFPAKDYPVAGMGAVLEFHDEVGFTYYTTLSRAARRTTKAPSLCVCKGTPSAARTAAAIVRQRI